MKANFISRYALNNTANIILEHGQNHQGYEDQDLANATTIFAGVLFDVLFTQYKDKLSVSELESLAENTGLAIRELINASTGKDTREIIKTTFEK